MSAYLLEQALSIDNIFVIALLFTNFRVPPHYQHRVLFWGILGAVVFRVIMLGGGAYLATKFTWIFYVFGAYLAFQGLKMLRAGHEEEANLDNHPAIRFLRRFVTIVDGEHGGKFSIIHNGRRALTTLAVCLIVVELTDIVFALDSIPAVLSVSHETFIMVTSNIFAILGLRSLYFVLAGAIAGLAGWLLGIRTSGATANLGTGLLFNAFAAVVIGGVSLKGGVGALPGVYAGVLLLSSINTAINLMGLPANFTQVIHGLLVLAAVMLDTFKQTIRRGLA